MITIKKYYKVRDHCHYTGRYRGAAHDICNLRHKIPNQIPLVYHNRSTYDYYFIIKELAEEFDGQFECLGENTEKYITFSVPNKKELDNGKSVTNKIKFIDRFRFMSCSLSTLVNNLSDINCEKCSNKHAYIRFRNNYMLLKCFHCNTQFRKKVKN